MLYAKSDTNERIGATPKARGYCPICSDQLSAKCGRIKEWHWSHQKRPDCDPWFEGETPWHLQWKRIVRSSNVEVVKGSHRADIVGRNGLVIELQHSPLSADAIETREAFYQNMIWLIDGTSLGEKFVLTAIDEEYPPRAFKFRWKWNKKHWEFAQKPRFIDLGKHIFEIRTLHPSPWCAGWGYRHSTGDFIRTYLQGVLASDLITAMIEMDFDRSTLGNSFCKEGRVIM